MFEGFTFQQIAGALAAAGVPMALAIILHRLGRLERGRDRDFDTLHGEEGHSARIRTLEEWRERHTRNHGPR